MDFIINILPSPSLSPIYKKSPKWSPSSRVVYSPMLKEIVLCEKEHSIVDLSGYLIENDYFDKREEKQEEKIKEKNEEKIKETQSILSFLQQTNKQTNKINRSKSQEDDENVDNLEIDMLEFEELISTYSIKELDELIEKIDAVFELIER